MQIRRFRPRDEALLFQVFFSAVHEVASRDYSPEQIKAWAPDDLDQALWAQRIQALNPFVVELGSKIVAYADLQQNGYIGHFYVAGSHPRQGIGTHLMAHLLAEAKSLGLGDLTADVSVTAEPFFVRQGFTVVERRFPVRRGVALANALMSRAAYVDTACTTSRI